MTPTPKMLGALVATVLLCAGPAQAQPAQGADHAGHHAAEAAPQSEGEVRKVDTAQGKVTLRHGPLANLDMPAMTMVFTVTDAKLLEGLRVGDKVRFVADKKDGTYYVTAMEVVK